MPGGRARCPGATSVELDPVWQAAFNIEAIDRWAGFQRTTWLGRRVGSSADSRVKNLGGRGLTCGRAKRCMEGKTPLR